MCNTGYMSPLELLVAFGVCLIAGCLGTVAIGAGAKYVAKKAREEAEKEFKTHAAV